MALKITQLSETQKSAQPTASYSARIAIFAYISFLATAWTHLLTMQYAKHIHLVARNKPISQCPDTNTNTCMLSGADLLLNEKHTSLLEMVAPYHQEKDIKIRIKHQLVILMSRVQHAQNADALLAAEKHLHSATSLKGGGVTIFIILKCFLFYDKFYTIRSMLLKYCTCDLLSMF